ncbi:hypothetical protein BDY17DRAFT_143289 [Neohortaea acidophila]|uniref:Uncharacterized protein n=1 Tax=Neohortaea acidophila TaxID=245834 RepID=A0A6A6PTW8_9PEZI|nr:uncharacterized protein BDY17DRAFT_143289 [Neohortaea acidophila]KAF2483206.1 hypothetical protein BDY17DRAFT_143289 [Neohortaea acidophila]
MACSSGVTLRLASNIFTYTLLCLPSSIVSKPVLIYKLLLVAAPLHCDMCTQLLEVYTCGDMVWNPTDSTWTRCGRKIWVTCRMPNGQVGDGEPHPDPRNGGENLCEEAVRLGVGFGKCSRGIEHYNTQEQPDPHGRRCQVHQDGFLAQMMHAGEVNLENTRLAVRRRRSLRRCR